MFAIFPPVYLAANSRPDCLSLDEKLKNEQPKAFDAATLVLKAMDVRDYNQAKTAEGRLLNNEQVIRYGYDAEKRDFEISKHGWNMTLTIVRDVVFVQNADEFNWDKSSAAYVLEQTSAETDFIFLSIYGKGFELSETTRKLAGLVCLNFGFQLEAIFDQIDKVEFSSLKIWPFDA